MKLKPSSIFFACFVLLLICFSNLIASAENEKRFEVIDKSKKYKARCYFFTSIPACRGCLINTNFAINTIDPKKNNIELVGFIYGLDDNGIKALKKENGWDFEVINDRLGVYHKYYEQENSNEFILLDDDGNFIDHFNTSNLKNETEFDKSYQRILKKPDNSNYSEISTTNVSFNDSTRKLLFDDSYGGLYSEKFNKYFFVGRDKMHLLVCDSSGTIENFIRVYSKIHFLQFPYMGNVRWKIKDSILFFRMAGLKRLENGKDSQGSCFFEYDIVKDSLNEVEIDPLFSIDIKGIFYHKDNLLFFKYMSSDTTPKNMDEYESIYIYNQNKDKFNRFCKLPEIYKKYDLIDNMNIKMIFKNEKIYLMYSLNNKIYIYDDLYCLQGEIELEEPTFYRRTKTDYSRRTRSKGLVTVYNQITSNYIIGYDSTNNRFLVIYRNLTYPKGTLSLRSPNRKTENFAVIYNSDGTIYCEYKLPEQHVYLIDFEDMVLTFYNADNKQLKIKKIKFHEPSNN
jgi:hypothetical protein